jgi:SprT protein
MPMPTVSFDLRGKKGGQAFLTKNHIRLNSVLLAENAEKFIEQTVGHEVAHLATHAKHGRGISPHGDEWQAMMRAFGLEPLRCHRYDTTNSAVGESFAFVCGCATPHLLGTRTLKSGLAGRRKCKKCKEILRPKDATLRASASGATAQPSSAPRALAIPPRVPARPAATVNAKVTMPTDAMVRFANDLARRHGLRLPAAVLRDFSACSQFIEEAKKLSAPELPTERQLAYASRLASQHGVTVPPAALKSRVALSIWLDNAQAKAA